MGKIILEFDSLEESDEARTAMDGIKYKLVIWDIDQELRKTTKYGNSILNHNQEASELEIEIAEKYRELLRELLEYNNVSLD